MTPEERVRYWLEHDNHPMNIFERTAWRVGIQRLANKAEAWDKLLDSLKDVLHGSQYAILKAKMFELTAPPKPKTKLERLEEMIKTGCAGSGTFIDAEYLLLKIQELKEEED